MVTEGEPFIISDPTMFTEWAVYDTLKQRFAPTAPFVHGEVPSKYVSYALLEPESEGTANTITHLGHAPACLVILSFCSNKLLISYATAFIVAKLPENKVIFQTAGHVFWNKKYNGEIYTPVQFFVNVDWDFIGYHVQPKRYYPCDLLAVGKVTDVSGVDPVNGASGCYGSDFGFLAAKLPPKRYAKRIMLYPAIHPDSTAVAIVVIGYPQAPDEKEQAEYIKRLYPQGELAGVPAEAHLTMEVANGLFWSFSRMIASFGKLTHSNAKIAATTASLTGGCSGSPVCPVRNNPGIFYGSHFYGAPYETQTFERANHNLMMSNKNPNYVDMYKTIVAPHINRDEIPAAILPHYDNFLAQYS